MATFGSRIKSAWNAFSRDNESEVNTPTQDYGVGYTYRPERTRARISNERSIISSIYTRIAIDVSGISIRHVRHDESDRYLEDIKSGLNDCLTTEANIDQAARAFRQDIVMTLLDKGCAPIVPVDTTISPIQTGGYDIRTMRVGEVLQWYPKHVRINLYNEEIGRRQEITLPKSIVAIAENPLYAIMNEPNSTMQRLVRKLSLLDTTDEQNSSGKLDLIIQLPYVIKTEARKNQAEQRRSDIEFQLKGSQYGIAYTDGTEKITQLNRAVENKLLEQVKDLREQLYAQLGVTPEIMNGTADEKTMLNYINRTIEPILDAIVEAMKRTFLTRTARTQMQSIDYFRDPFKLVPVSQIAEIADKFARNEIVSSNEVRQAIGMKPSKDPKADQLINSNMPQDKTGLPTANAPAVEAPPPTPVDVANPQEDVAVAAEAGLDQQMAELGIS